MDTHYCLNCRTVIDGLDNYVAHRKQHCLQITGKAKPASPARVAGVISTTTVPSSPPVLKLSQGHDFTNAPTQSPTQLSKAVSSSGVAKVSVSIEAEVGRSAAVTEDGTGVMLYDGASGAAVEVTSEMGSIQGYGDGKEKSGEGEGEGAGQGEEGGKGDGGGGNMEDFLTTLELQVREKDKRIGGDDPQEGKIIEDKLKTLDILNFSSDSDDLPSDVDELLDYANEEEEQEHHSSRRVSRGKWGPSGKGKGKNVAGKNAKQPPRTYGGKGSKLRSHTRQSAAKSDTKDQTHADDSDNEAPEPTKAEKLECKPCSRTFVGQHSYNRHLKSRFHKHKLNPKTKKVKVKQEIECPVCEKVFNSKYNFARHLASTYHTRREAANEPMVLDENIQRLLLKQSPVQCHVCSFYCADMAVMFQHMETENHIDRCSELSGPLVCVRCKFRVYSNTALLQHLRSPEHKEMIKSSGRPCIVREVRCNVPCQVCYKEFHSVTQLEQHIREHHKPGASEDPLKRPPKQKGVRYKMPCPFCNKEWDTTFALNIHIKRRHTKEKPFPCKSCGVAFTDAASLRGHEATKKHINQQVVVGLLTAEEAVNKMPQKIKIEKQPAVSQLRNVCQECDYTTDYHIEMKAHYQTEHPDKVLFCKPCSFETFLEKQFEKHKATSSHAKRAASYKPEEEEGEYQCEICLTRYASKDKLELHQLAHSTIMSEKQLRAAHDGDPLVGVHPRFHDFWHSSCMSKTKKITCVECQQEVMGQNMLGHLRIHSDSYPFQCTKCTLKFASASSLRRHMSTIHLNIKLHECTQCGERFSRRTYLFTHLLRTHGDSAGVECPHECNTCQKRFPLKHMLTAHETSHSDHRPHRCDWEGCEAAYKSKYEMELHRRGHTGEKPFVCEFCGYSATGKQKLTRHLRTHTQERNYSCQYCEYKAQNSTHLHRHMRIHIGSKPYKCPYCPHACNTHENIRKHILRTKRHRGLPCYPCQQCDYGTNVIKEFAQHLTDVHGKKIDPKEILSVVAGVFNKEEDTKDIPEGSCALPVKEKLLSPVKTSVGSELKRKREKSAQSGQQNNSAVIIQVSSKKQKITHFPEIMVNYEPQPVQNIVVTQALQTQALQTQALQTQALQTQALQTQALQTQALQTQALQTQTLQTQALQSQALQTQALQTQALQTPQTLQTIHIDKDTTETVTLLEPQQQQVIEFDPISTTMEMVPYTDADGVGGGVTETTHLFEHGNQHYQMVYTTAPNSDSAMQQPQQQHLDIMAAAAENLELTEEGAGQVEGHVVTDSLQSLGNAMQGIHEAGAEEHLEAIEVDEATLLRLHDANKVQWVTADGTVVLCGDAEQLYEKFNMVVYDGKTEDGAGEMVVYDGKTEGAGEMVVYDGKTEGAGEMVVYNGKTEEGDGDLQGAVGEVVVGGDEATIFVENPEAFCKQEPALE